MFQEKLRFVQVTIVFCILLTTSTTIQSLHVIQTQLQQPPGQPYPQGIVPLAGGRVGGAGIGRRVNLDDVIFGGGGIDIEDDLDDDDVDDNVGSRFSFVNRNSHLSNRNKNILLSNSESKDQQLLAGLIGELKLIDNSNSRPDVESSSRHRQNSPTSSSSSHRTSLHHLPYKHQTHYLNLEKNSHNNDHENDIVTDNDSTSTLTKNQNHHHQQLFKLLPEGLLKAEGKKLFRPSSGGFGESTANELTSSVENSDTNEEHHNNANHLIHHPRTSSSSSSSSSSTAQGSGKLVDKISDSNSRKAGVAQSSSSSSTGTILTSATVKRAPSGKNSYSDSSSSMPVIPHSIASQMMLRNTRGQRQYDVPQIECPPAMDGMERFACPTPDRQGRFRCIDDHVLCDGFIDCPKGEDEDRQACMFYKTTKAHLDVLADALLRWARGR